MRRRLWLSVLLALVWACTLFANHQLTFEERVEAQRAIERVYYNHRIWPEENPGPKPPFESMVSDDDIIHKVETYLTKSSALQQYWSQSITVEQLQGELERMGRETMDPEVLKEIFSALGYHPGLIAECLARPWLVDRLLRRKYAYDNRFQGELRRKVLSIQDQISSDTFETWPDGTFHEFHFKKDKGNHVPSNFKDAQMISSAEFDDLSKPFPEHAGEIRLDETAEAFILRLTLQKENDEIHGAIRVFYKIPFDTWFEEKVRPCINVDNNLSTDTASYTLPAIREFSGEFRPDSWLTEESTPNNRSQHTAVWTGTEMIIWGGYTILNGKNYPLNTGARYNPSVGLSGSWIPMSTYNAPTSRLRHTAVWTGNEMIIWGGLDRDNRTNSGGRYDPVTDTWTETEISGAPDPRYGHTAIWIGSEMVVWGGEVCTDYPGCSTTEKTNTGGRYNPATDTWTATSTIANVPSGRDGHTAIYGNNLMIVWGGFDGSNYLNTGGMYNPGNDSWTPTPLSGVPTARANHTAVWSGQYMYVWGGYGCYDSGCTILSYLNTGGGLRKQAVNYVWSTMTTTNAPWARADHTAVWASSYGKMIIWGGYGGGWSRLGGMYSPDTWVTTSLTDAPGAREGHTAVWTGSYMFLWGGECLENGCYEELVYGDGFIFNPQYDPGLWDSMTELGDEVKENRSRHSSIWTGSEMIVWGGLVPWSSLPVNTGYLYQPSLGLRQNLSTLGAPDARTSPSAVWTGEEMIIFGGRYAESSLGSGNSYDPGSDTWTAIPDSPARGYHSAIWTGSAMVVWGGYDGTGTGEITNSGARYYPGTSSWTTMTTSGAPSARAHHTGVWTGESMIVWGGCGYLSPGIDEDECPGPQLNTGGIYSFNEVDPNDPGSWTATSDTGSPSERYRHSAIWTGDEMIIWGGAQCAGSVPCDDSYNYLNDGYRYDPSPMSPSAWTPITTRAQLSYPRAFHSATWTGSEMIIWGGRDGSGYLNSGEYYDPDADTWRNTSFFNSPSARYHHTALWTGGEMIIAGGTPDGDLGFYFPNSAPTSAPEILNEVDGEPDTIKIGDGDPLELTHLLNGFSPTTWMDDVEGGQKWTCSPDPACPDGQWHIVTNENCTTQSDFTSPYHAWRFGSSFIPGEFCTAGDSIGGPGIYTLISAFPFAVDPNSLIEFRYYLRADNFHSDSARVEACTCTSSIDCSNCSGGGIWITLAMDTSHFSSWMDPAPVQLEDFCVDWKAAQITMPDYLPVGSHVLVRFSYERKGFSDASLGWLLDDVGIGVPGADGSNPCSAQVDSQGNDPQDCIPYHDMWDKATFSWDLDGDDLPDNPDENSPTWSIPEEDLDNYGLNVPGDHDLALRVTDLLGIDDENTITLHVKDGIPPIVDVKVPNGGESWDYSTDNENRTDHFIVWESSDNFLVQQTALYYSTDSGGTWTCIADSMYKNYSDKISPTPIPDNDSNGVEIELMIGDSISISDINVRVMISHPRVSDLSIALYSPMGTRVGLADQSGVSGSGYNMTLFDDEALIVLDEGSSPYTGLFRPEENLSDFDGENSVGTWTLKIVDWVAGEVGFIENWWVNFSDCNNMNLAGSDTLEADSQNFWWTMPTLQEAGTTLPPQIFPSATSQIKVVVNDLSDNETSDTSSSNFYIIQPTTTAIRTLIVWDS
ncbi:MAG TPA: kelch repeat-containing protein, partial [Thermoanaerobaculia bacterium]|nr:kelch repeat-containing protein [Thermoanaerobaculia bacterium]HXK67459.1 kelch repeat-containing protein [Thermoanaerobaculia bacterium]